MNMLQIFHIYLIGLSTFVNSKLSDITMYESICFPNYNVFLDTSQQTTIQQSIMRQNDKLYTTQPNFQDQVDFQKLQRYEVYFDGQTGLMATYSQLQSLQIPLSTLSWQMNFALSNWTLSFWFKLDQPYPWETQSLNQMLVYFEVNQGQQNQPPIVLSCQIMNNQNLTCFPEFPDKQISINLVQFGIQKQEWYFVSIDSTGNTHRMQIWDKSWTQYNISQVNSTGQISLGNSNIYLALSNQQSMSNLNYSSRTTGFVGAMKQVTIFRQVFTASRLYKNMAFQTMVPLKNEQLILSLPLTDTQDYSGLFEQLNKINFSVFNRINSSSSLTQTVDQSPNWNCHRQDQNDFGSFFRFQGPSTVFQNLTLVNYTDVSSRNGSYQLTLKMWFYREDLSSTKNQVQILPNGSISGRPSNPFVSNGQDETLFDHDGILTIAFFANSSDYLTYYNFNDPSKKIQVLVPRGQWIWLQAEHSENYFSIEVRDQRNKVLKSAFEYVLHTVQNNFKTNAYGVRIAPNFYGYIEGLKYFKNLQVSKEPDQFNETLYLNGSALLYFRFDRDSYSQGKFPNMLVFGSFNPVQFIDVTNYASASGTDIQVYQPQIIFDRVMQNTINLYNNSGAIYYDVSWDGATCSSDKENILFSSDQQVLQLNFSSQDTQISDSNQASSLTLEFWLQLFTFPTQQPSIQYSQTILELQGIGSGKTYMDIQINNGNLSCNLYQDGMLLQSITYSDVNTGLNRWYHIQCFFDGGPIQSSNQNRNTSINLLRGRFSSLQRNSYAEYYYGQSLVSNSQSFGQYISRQVPLQIPETELQLIIQGPPNINTFNNTAYKNFTLQEIRIWTRTLSFDDYFLQRNKKLSLPQDMTNLSVYAPLTEGVRYPYDFYNFVNGKKLAQTGQFSTVVTLQNSTQPGPLVCPYQTVFSFTAPGGCVIRGFLRQNQSFGIISRGQNDTFFTVSTDDMRYSEAAKGYFRAVAPNLLRYQWAILGLAGPVPCGAGNQSSLNQSISGLSNTSSSLPSSTSISTLGNPQSSPSSVSSFSVGGNSVSGLLDPMLLLTDPRLTNSSSIPKATADCLNAYIPFVNQLNSASQDFRENAFIDTARLSDIIASQNALGSQNQPQNIVLVNFTLNVTNTYSVERMQPLLNVPISAALNPCASFYEKTTGLAYIDQELQFQRGSQNFTFQFVGTDCDDFYFDSTNASNFKLELQTAEGPRVGLPKWFSRNGSSVSLPTTPFPAVSSTERFYVIASGTFRSKYWPQISQDLSIIFRLRWAQVLKLDIQSQVGLVQGTDLVLDASSAQLINAYQSPLGGPPAWTWLCPAQFDCSNITTNSSILKITSQQLNSIVSVENLRKYSFTLQIRSPQYLTNQQSFYEKQILVAWLGTPTGVRVQYSPSNTVSKDLVFQLVGTDPAGQPLPWFSDVGLQWSISGADAAANSSLSKLDYTKGLVNSNNQAKFIVARGFLTAANYGVVLRLFANSFGAAKVFEQTYTIKMQPAPFKGNFTIDKPIGDALSQVFTIRADNWQSYNATPGALLTYQYFYLSQDQVTQALSSAAPGLTSLRTVLPQTDWIVVRVIDDMGGTTLQQLPVRIRLNPAVTTYQSFVQDTQQLLSDPGRSATDFFRQLGLWTGSLQVLSKNFAPQDIDSVSGSIADTISFKVQAIKNQSLDTRSQYLIAQSASQQLKQILDANPVKSSKLISQTLGVLDTIQGQAQAVAQGLMAQDSKSRDTLQQLLSIVFQDTLDKGYQMNQSSVMNETIRNQAMSFRQQLMNFEINIGQSLQDGQKLTSSTSGLELSAQRFLRSSEPRDDVSFVVKDDTVRFIFPLSGANQPTDSQILTSIIISNGASAYNQNAVPDFYTQGGPFAGNRFQYQKILSNNTVYLAYRDIQGAYLDKSSGLIDSTVSKVRIEFKINSTDYIRSIFRQGSYKNIKCSYVDIEKSVVNQLMTSECTTTIIDSQNRILWDQSMDQNLSSAQVSMAADSVSSSAFFTTQCLCSHMSYYTVVEEVDLVQLIGEVSLVPYVARDFKDWPVLVCSLVLFVEFMALLIYSTAKDSKDLRLLRQTDEGKEELPGDPVHPQQARKFSNQLGLLTWIFHRKLMIEPYAIAQAEQAAPLDYDHHVEEIKSVSKWILFKIFFWQLHPLFSIGSQFDLTLSRFDRALLLILRIIITIPISYFTMPVASALWDPQKSAITVDSQLIIRCVIVCTVCSFILLPLPSWVYGGCRAKYKVRNNILSIDEGDLESTTELSQLISKRNERKIYLGSQWPVSHTMRINSIPFHFFVKKPGMIDDDKQVKELYKKLACSQFGSGVKIGQALQGSEREIVVVGEKIDEENQIHPESLSDKILKLQIQERKNPDIIQISDQKNSSPNKLNNGQQQYYQNREASQFREISQFNAEEEDEVMMGDRNPSVENAHDIKRLEFEGGEGVRKDIQLNEFERASTNTVNQRSKSDLRRNQMLNDISDTVPEFNQEGCAELKHGGVTPANMFQDQNGNILEVDERPEFQSQQGIEDDLDQNAKLTRFFDEKKVIVQENNLCTKLIARTIVFLIIILILTITVKSYIMSVNYERSSESVPWIVCLFISQLVNFLILSPILLLLHAILYGSGFYNVACCKFQKYAFPVSHMLAQDLKEYAYQIIEIKKNEKKVFGEIIEM